MANVDPPFFAALTKMRPHFLLHIWSTGGHSTKTLLESEAKFLAEVYESTIHRQGENEGANDESHTNDQEKTHFFREFHSEIYSPFTFFVETLELTGIYPYDRTNSNNCQYERRRNRSMQKQIVLKNFDIFLHHVKIKENLFALFWRTENRRGEPPRKQLAAREYVNREGGRDMKKCPKCGKMNFSNVSFCSDCGDNLEFVHADNDYQPSQHLGMHWFFAWLIMQGSGLLGGLLINSILGGILANMSISALRSSLPMITNIVMILLILLTYLVIFIWIKLTFKRYFYAGPWNFFTYLWFVSTPFLMMIEFSKALSGIKMSMILPWIITILGILIGIVGFTVYKKKLEDQL